MFTNPNFRSGRPPEIHGGVRGELTVLSNGSRSFDQATSSKKYPVFNLIIPAGKLSPRDASTPPSYFICEPIVPQIRHFWSGCDSWSCPMLRYGDIFARADILPSPARCWLCKCLLDSFHGDKVLTISTSRTRNDCWLAIDTGLSQLAIEFETRQSSTAGRERYFHDRFMTSIMVEPARQVALWTSER